MTRPTNQPWSV
ncbi:hypothetical protein Zm00014a_032654 [Zea mays]|uniref:Uncharacterized protein n=1 Tax=Zea mays TaxID=4577 RepID=A0A3L6FR12_MAIZE|nr:hypothetical protein Zm00014a_032654 [Zea mays]